MWTWPSAVSVSNQMPHQVDSTHTAATVPGSPVTMRFPGGSRGRTRGPGEQYVDDERGRGVGLGQPVDGGPLVLAQRVQEASAGEGAQQGVAQDVGGEGCTAGGFGFLLLAALLVLQLPGALAFGVGRELVLDHGVGVRVVHAASVGEQLHDARPLSDFGRPRSSPARSSWSRTMCCCSSASSRAAAASGCVIPRARRRTERRPTFAQSTGSRGAAAR